MKKQASQTEPKSSLLESEIFYSIRHSQYKNLALYVRHNFNLNITSKDGRNGLFYALDINNSSKRCRMIKYCLEHGINPLHKENIHGYTVLHESIARQQIDSFHLILAEVSGEIDWRSLDLHGRTILHQAVESNNSIILEELITIMNRYSISVDVVDKNGLTPYLLAIKLHLRDMSEILLKKGRASRQKCDLQTHRSAREWESIGFKENHLILRKKLRDEINDAMRNGKISKVHNLKRVYYPKSSLSLTENQRRDSYITTQTSRSCLNTKSSLSSDGDKSTLHWDHLPPLTNLPPYRSNSSFNSLIDLFQIAQISS